MILAPFLCAIATISDGDTFRCTDGTRIRMAGVNAREIHGDPCPRDRPCPAMSAVRSREVLVDMIQGHTLKCERVGVSYKRVVARCGDSRNGDLSCAVIAAGAAQVWPQYWRRYKLPECTPTPAKPD